MRLEPCPKCERHVRVSEQSCPFCGVDLAQSFAALPERKMPSARMGRAALFAFGAAAAATAAMTSGCVDEPDAEDDERNASLKDAGPKDAALPQGDATPVYGASPFFDAGAQDAEIRAPEGGVAPLYGLPVFPEDASINDAGNTDAGTRRDAGGTFIPLYGLAVPPDTNKDNR